VATGSLTFSLTSNYQETYCLAKGKDTAAGKKFPGRPDGRKCGHFWAVRAVSPACRAEAGSYPFKRNRLQLAATWAGAPTSRPNPKY